MDSLRLNTMILCEFSPAYRLTKWYNSDSKYKHTEGDITDMHSVQSNIFTGVPCPVMDY